jgi:mono/diheme cytochrome c family protein
MSFLEIGRMARGALFCMLVAVVTTFIACGGPAQETAEPPAAVDEEVVVEETVEEVEVAPAPEAGAEGDAEEAAGGAGDVAKGKAVYATYCSACHGEGGKGDGPAAASLTTKPRNHTDGVVMNELTQEHMVLVIKEGGASIGKSNLMPAWGATLTDEQIGDTIAFVRSLADPPYQGAD